MIIKKGDFIEIDFTGKTPDKGVFDSTVKEELEKLHHGHSHEVKAEPFAFGLGHGMFLKAIDDFLTGKETGKLYEIDLSPEQAFGQRRPELVQTMPMKVFLEKKINPVQGATLNFDGRVGKILAVSGGRVMVDFNHFLSGKPVHYSIKVLKKITDETEKIKALNKFFFGKEFKSEVSEKRIVLHVEKQMARLVELFKDKFKEILGLDLEVKEIGEKPEDNK